MYYYHDYYDVDLTTTPSPTDKCKQFATNSMLTKYISCHCQKILCFLHIRLVFLPKTGDILCQIHLGTSRIEAVKNEILRYLRYWLLVAQSAPVALGSCIHPNSKHTRTTSSTACSAVLVPCPQCCSLDMVMLTHIGRSCCRGVSPCRNKHFWENTG